MLALSLALFLKPISPLFFGRKHAVHSREEPYIFNLKSSLLSSLACRALFEGLTMFEMSAHESIRTCPSRWRPIEQGLYAQQERRARASRRREKLAASSRLAVKEMPKQKDISGLLTYQRRARLSDTAPKQARRTAWRRGLSCVWRSSMWRFALSLRRFHRVHLLFEGATEGLSDRLGSFPFVLSAPESCQQKSFLLIVTHLQRFHANIIH